MTHIDSIIKQLQQILLVERTNQEEKMEKRRMLQYIPESRCCRQRGSSSLCIYCRTTQPLCKSYTKCLLYFIDYVIR